MPSAVNSAATLGELVHLARGSIDPRVWNYIVGGANGELSLRANRAALAAYELLPDMFVGITRPDPSTELFGVPLTMPVFLSPFGYDRAYHPGGYPEAARAVARAGVTSIVSESSSDSLETIAPELGGQIGMVQLALFGPDEHVLGYAERMAAAGYRGVCLTDLPSRFWRERMLEAGIDLNPTYGQGNILTPEHAEVRRAHSAFETARWDWDRVARFVPKLPLPWILKGVLTASDARRAVDLGASGVYVSNFGGRNLDGMPATMSRLVEVVDEVSGKVPVLVDSGFRRGTDVVKALALGASAVGLGRLGAVALAAGGEAGVTRMLELLGRELTWAMGVLGASRLTDLDRRHVPPAAGPGGAWTRTARGSFLDPAEGPLPLI